MKERDKAAEERFQAIYADCYRPVLGYALRRVPDHFAAQDVVAETFTTAWRRLDDLPAQDECLPWLLGVARATIRNQRRRPRSTRMCPWCARLWPG